jgi:hypothetical protein
MGWLIIGGAFAVVFAVSALLSHRWGRGSHSPMSENLEIEAHRRGPKTWI